MTNLIIYLYGDICERPNGHQELHIYDLNINYLNTMTYEQYQDKLATKFLICPKLPVPPVVQTWV